MKWIGNIYDPKLEDARFYIEVGYRETREEAWKRHLKWLEGKIISEPRATESFTAEDLKRMGFVGVYED